MTMKSAKQAINEGWELTFNSDLNNDDLIGTDFDQNGQWVPSLGIRVARCG